MKRKQLNATKKKILTFSYMTIVLSILGNYNVLPNLIQREIKDLLALVAISCAFIAISTFRRLISFK